MPLAYYLLLPRPEEFSEVEGLAYEEVISGSSNVPYTALSTTQDDEPSFSHHGTSVEDGSKLNVALSLADKWDLAKPLIAKYMLPLCKDDLFLLEEISLIDLQSACIL